MPKRDDLLAGGNAGLETGRSMARRKPVTPEEPVPDKLEAKSVSYRFLLDPAGPDQASTETALAQRDRSPASRWSMMLWNLSQVQFGQLTLTRWRITIRFKSLSDCCNPVWEL